MFPVAQAHAGGVGHQDKHGVNQVEEARRAGFGCRGPGLYWLSVTVLGGELAVPCTRKPL
jgi:hypothetical protein